MIFRRPSLGWAKARLPAMAKPARAAIADRVTAIPSTRQRVLSEPALQERSDASLSSAPAAAPAPGAASQFPPSDGDCHTPLPCARCAKGRITRDERAVPNSAALGGGGAHAGHRLQRSAAWPEDSGLISRDLSSAAPLHFLSDLQKMLTRAVFSEGDAARLITASQPPGRALQD